MFSENDILFSKKSKKGVGQMNKQVVEDVKNTALKLDEIRKSCPENYFYLKGWIHCLLQRENGSDQSCKLPRTT